jgi:molecular chaperone DnaK
LGIPPAPRGIPQIEVAFDIDANGIVHVSAKDLATAREQKIRIESSSGLSEAEIQKMVRDAEVHAQEDQDKRKNIEVRNNADSLVYSTERTLREQADKIPAQDKAGVEAALTELKSVMNSDNVPAIEAAMQKVVQASHKVAEALYAAAAQQQAGAQAGPQPGAGAGAGAGGGSAQTGPAKDGTVDADFTVVDDDDKKK